MNEQERTEYIKKYNATHGHPVKMTSAGYFFGIDTTHTLRAKIKDTHGCLFDKWQNDDTYRYIIMLNLRSFKKYINKEGWTEDRLIKFICAVISHEVGHLVIQEIYSNTPTNIMNAASFCLDSPYMKNMLSDYGMIDETKYGKKQTLENRKFTMWCAKKVREYEAVEIKKAFIERDDIHLVYFTTSNDKLWIKKGDPVE